MTMAARTESPAGLPADTRPGTGLRATVAGVGQAIVTGRVQLPLLTLITLISLVIPVSFTVGGLLLKPSRVVFLVATPVLLVRLFQGRYGKVTAIDWLVLLHVCWISLAIFVNNFNVAITFTGSTVVMILGGYLVTRATVRSPDHLAGVALFLALTVLFSLPFALYETRTGRFVIPPLLEMIPGLEGPGKVNYRPRMGLYRVQFIFNHPIHYGLFCSVAFSLCYIGLRQYLSQWSRLVMSAVILVCTFLSVSSGPFLSLMVQFFLILWAITMRWMRKPWKVLIIIVVTLYVIAELASTRPAVYAVVSMLAFSPETANVRKVLLEYGIAQVMRDPILGNGHNSWPLPAYMSGSVDNQWLLLALSYGLPTLISLVLALAILFRRVTSNPSMSPQFRDLRTAWMFTMVSLILTLATVAIWSEIQSFFYFIIGCGVWMTTWRDPEAGGAAAAAPAQAGGLRFTRFDAGRRTALPAGGTSDPPVPPASGALPAPSPSPYRR